jgi:hypothetical protein
MKEPLLLSAVFPNRPESDSAMSRIPVPGQQLDVEFCSTTPASPPQTTTAPRRKAKVSRQLTPQKIGVAWEKVRRVVRDLCRQRGRECPLCRPYGNRIEFQYAAEYQLIVLDLDGDRIVAHIGNRKWTVRIVRIKSGGSGYEIRREIRTATWLLIELLKEARRSSPIPKRDRCERAETNG